MRYGNKTGKFVLRYVEAGVDHVQRREQAILQKLVECLARYNFNDTAENIETQGVFPDFARLMQQWQRAEARDERGKGLVAPEWCFRTVQSVYRRIAKTRIA